LRSHGIPFFIDRRHPTTHHPLVEFIRCALRLQQTSHFADALVGILKTGLTLLDADQSDLLENYALARDLRSVAEWSDEHWLVGQPGTESANVPPESVVAARNRLLAAFGDWWPASSDVQTHSCRKWA